MKGQKNGRDVVKLAVILVDFRDTFANGVMVEREMLVSQFFLPSCQEILDQRENLP